MYVHAVLTVPTYVCSQCVHSLTELQDHVAVWGSKKMLVYNLVPDKETIKTVGTYWQHPHIHRDV